MPGVAAAPMPPAPRMESCPPNWIVTDAGGSRYCTAWTSPPPTCEADEALVPGDGCASLGAECPAGDFPDDTEAGAVFVRPGGTGDGSRGAPFGTLAEALAVPASSIVLSRGDHDIGDLVVATGTNIEGACVGGTALLGSLRFTVGASHLSQVTLTAPVGPAVHIESGAEVSLEAIVAKASDDWAIASAGSLTAAEGRLNGGAVVTAGTASFSRVAFVDGPTSENPRYPLGALEVGAGEVDGNDLSFTGDPGGAVAIRAGARAALGRVMVDGAGGFGALVDGSGAMLSLEDAVVRSIGRPDYVQSAGLRATAGADLSTTRTAIDRAEHIGLHVDEASTASAEDLLVLDTEAGFDGRQGMGVRVIEASRFTLRRGEIVGSRCAGVRASAQGVVDMEDVTVRNTRGEELTGEAGFGLRADSQASVTARRVVIDRSRHAGVIVDSLAELIAEDLVVRNTESRERAMTGGHGLHVTLGSRVEITRAEFEHSREAGISVAGSGASVVLRDVAVRDTASNDLGGHFGSGISVSAGSLDAERVTLERNRYVGLYVGERATATVSGLEISTVTAQSCADDACAETPFGVGLGAFNAGALTVVDFVVHDAALCGVMVASAADLALREGQVMGSLIGACIQVTAFEVSKISDAVAYDGNQRNLDSTSLPVPVAAPPIMD